MVRSEACCTPHLPDAQRHENRLMMRDLPGEGNALHSRNGENSATVSPEDAQYRSHTALQLTEHTVLHRESNGTLYKARSAEDRSKVGLVGATMRGGRR